jgi:putative ATP-dependent endonuclease of OLD family
VTDNDEKEAAKTASYSDYARADNITVCIGKDDTFPTLEPQLLKVNGLDNLNSLLGTAYRDEASLLQYMKSHKTDVALKIFDSARPFVIPDYIKDAIR